MSWHEGDADDAVNDLERGPLSGLRVLEVGHVVAAPFTTLLLADMGADVVKLEPPDGDALRKWPPFPAGDETETATFSSLNRNKRSVALDLKSPEGLASARRLAADAHVLVENYRTGTLSRLGLGYEDVSLLNPDIIYCTLSGYGTTGPKAKAGAYDVVIQAESGLMSVIGESDSETIKSGVPVADFTAGQYAAYAIVCALVRRTRRPLFIDCSMLESLLSISALQTSEYWITGQAPEKLGSGHSRNAPYQAFRSADRPIVVAAGTQRLWETLCHIIDAYELLDDPRFSTQALRVAHVAELEALLEKRFTTKPASYWLRLLTDHGVPCGPVNDFAEALASPQISERGFLRSIDASADSGRSTPCMALPFHFGGQNVFELRAAPRFGEHTELLSQGWVDVETGGRESAGTRVASTDEGIPAW